MLCEFYIDSHNIRQTTNGNRSDESTYYMRNTCFDEKYILNSFPPASSTIQKDVPSSCYDSMCPGMMPMSEMGGLPGKKNRKSHR